MNDQAHPTTVESDGHAAIRAPQWLIERMESIKSMTPPTLNEVRQQFEASANARAHYDKTGEWSNEQAEARGTAASANRKPL